MIGAGDNDEDATVHLDRFLAKISKKVFGPLHSIVRVLINILNKNSDSEESKSNILSSIKILCDILIVSINNSSLEKSIHRLENFFDLDDRSLACNFQKSSFTNIKHMKHMSVCTTESLTLNLLQNLTNGKTSPEIAVVQTPKIPPAPAPPGTGSAAAPNLSIRQKIAAEKIAAVDAPHTVWTPVVAVEEQTKKSLTADLNLDDFELLDMLFEQEVKEIDVEKRNGTVTECLTVNRKRRDAGALTLFGSRRSLNINIFLNKEDVHELLDSIAFGDSGRLGADKLENLLKLLPDSEEIDFLSSRCSDFCRLAQAEQFMLQLIALDNYKLRIESMLLKEDFDSTVNRIKSSLNILTSTAEGILDCKRLKEILHLILTIGNYLNSGTEIGEAPGFRLSSLMKIVELRSTRKNNLTLMHHILSILERISPTLLDFSHDLMFLEEAASKDINEISTEFTHLKSKVETMSSQMSLINGDFGVQMAIFLNYAKRELISIEQELSNVENLRQKLAEYFCDNDQTFKMRDCLKILRDFKRRFLKATKDTREKKSQKHKLEILSIQNREAPPSYASPFISRRVPPNLAAQIFCDKNDENSDQNQSQILLIGSILAAENRPSKSTRLPLPASDQENCRRRSSSSAFRRQESRERDLLVPKCRPSTSRETPTFLVENFGAEVLENSPVQKRKMDFFTAKLKFNEKKNENRKYAAFDEESLIENLGSELTKSGTVPNLSEISNKRFDSSDDFCSTAGISSNDSRSNAATDSQPAVCITAGELLPPGPRRRPSTTSSSSSSSRTTTPSSASPEAQRCRCGVMANSRNVMNRPACGKRYDGDRDEGFETGSAQSRHDRILTFDVGERRMTKTQNRQPLAPKRKTLYPPRMVAWNLENSSSKKGAENMQKSSIGDRQTAISDKKLQLCGRKSPISAVTRSENTKKKMDKTFQRLKSPVTTVKSEKSSSIATRKPWR
uniref:FH2 domain-containing protein n=1 Tax=Romanomermis culicivorax TaxID=13658 RepID=A0A915ICS4_ROMCU